MVLFVAGGVAYLAFGGTRYITLDGAKQHAATLRAFTDAHYVEALALAFATYAIAASLSLPSGTVLSLTFGFLFGRWVATALVVTAATVGATVVFLAARYLFGEAARRCRDGGLDGIEISMAHNHLIDQFWSPLFNQRRDDYGGSLENRMRFGDEVVREIRRRVGGLVAELGVARR